MSRGSKIVPVRIPDELLDEVEVAVSSQNYHTKGEPHTLSGWIRKCIAEKLAHLKRSNKKRKRICGIPIVTNHTESES